MSEEKTDPIPMSRTAISWPGLTCICGRPAMSILVIDEQVKTPFCGSNNCEQFLCTAVHKRRERNIDAVG